MKNKDQQILEMKKLLKKYDIEHLMSQHVKVPGVSYTVDSGEICINCYTDEFIGIQWRMLKALNEIVNVVAIIDHPVITQSKLDFTKLTLFNRYKIWFNYKDDIDV